MPGIELKIAVIRQRRSQCEVARASGIELTRLNRILNGWIKPRPDELNAICAVLNLDRTTIRQEGNGE